MGHTTQRTNGTVANSTSLWRHAKRATLGILAATSGVPFSRASAAEQAPVTRTSTWAWADRYARALGWDAPTSVHVHHALRASNGQPTSGVPGRCLRSQAQRVAYLDWRSSEGHLRDYLASKPDLQRSAIAGADKNESAPSSPSGDKQSGAHFIVGGTLGDAVKLERSVGCCQGYEGWAQDFVEHEHVVNLLNRYNLRANCTSFMHGRIVHTGFGDPQMWQEHCSVAVQCRSGVWNLADARPLCDRWQAEAENWAERLHDRTAGMEQGFISLPAIMCAHADAAGRFALAVEDIGYQYDRLAFLLGYFGPLAEHGQEGGRRMEAGLQREMRMHMALLEDISQKHPATHASWREAMALVLPLGPKVEL